jgi:hypothetical protein
MAGSNVVHKTKKMTKVTKKRRTTNDRRKEEPTESVEDKNLRLSGERKDNFVGEMSVKLKNENEPCAGTK